MIGLFLFFGLFFGIFALAAWQNRARAEGRAELARRLGLEHGGAGLFEPGWIAGRLDGFGVGVRPARVGEGDREMRVTRYELRFDEAMDPDALRERASLHGELWRALGAREAERFEILAGFAEGEVPRGPWGTIKQELSRAALRHEATLRELSIEPRRVVYDQPTPELDPGHVEGILRTLVAFGKAVTAEPTISEERLAAALRRQREGDLQGTLEGLSEAREAQPEPREAADLDARLLEGEALYVAGRYAEAEHRFDEALQGSEVIDEGRARALRRWRAQARARSAAAAAAAEQPARAQVAPEPVAPSLQMTEVAGALFHAGLEDVAIEERFHERFEGRAARAEGEIRGAMRLSVDAVFGFEPFTRLTLRLPSPLGATTLARSVQVLAKLGDEDASALRRRLGETVTLRGRLVACDVFGRNLYLDEAKLEAEEEAEDER